METKKLVAFTESPVQNDDIDMHFFKSILPYLKKMSPIQKLRVRNDMQNKLIRESLPSRQHFVTTYAHNKIYNILPVSTIHGSTYDSSPSTSDTSLMYSVDTFSSI